MGCLLSKKSSSGQSAAEQDQSHHHGSTHCDVHNTMHSHELGSPGINLDSVLQVVLQNNALIDENNKGVSLTNCPPTESLLCRSWIYKRGHMVRSWKRRYCVLDKSDIKYFLTESKNPPYGQTFKGKVALLGAVCVVSPSDDGKKIEVEIYGNHGEKDLFFCVDNDEAGQEFIRILQWAIRKATLTMLARNRKAGLAGKIDEKQSCTGWIDHHNLLYQASIQNLQAPGVFHFINIEESGEIVVRPAIMRLWTAFGGDFVPNLSTEPQHMGIEWKFVSPEELSKVMNDSEGTLTFPSSSSSSAAAPQRRGSAAVTESVAKDDVRVLTFEDIADITYHRLDQGATQWFSPHMKAFHHTERCADRYLIITLQTLFGHDIHVLACCLNDYNETFLSLRHILLFLQARSRLDRGATMDKSKWEENPTAAAMAIRLLGD